MKHLVLNFIPDEWEMILQITIAEESRRAIDTLASNELNSWTKVFFEKLIIELEKITGPICKGTVERIKEMSEDDEVLISEDLKLMVKNNCLVCLKKHEGCLIFIEK